MTFEQLNIGQYFKITCYNQQIELKKISDDYAIYKETENIDGAVTALKVDKEEPIYHVYHLKDLFDDIERILSECACHFHNDIESYVKVSSIICNLIDDWEANNKD